MLALLATHNFQVGCKAVNDVSFSLAGGNKKAATIASRFIICNHIQDISMYSNSSSRIMSHMFTFDFVQSINQFRTGELRVGVDTAASSERLRH